MENNERFLPIGSVVILKGGKRELMIMSYCVMPNGGEVYDKNGKVEDAPKLFDYGACFYPEGMVTSDQIFAFNHEQIDRVCFKGYETDRYKDRYDDGGGAIDRRVVFHRGEYQGAITIARTW